MSNATIKICKSSNHSSKCKIKMLFTTIWGIFYRILQDYSSQNYSIVQLLYGHVHKFEAGFGYFVDILMAVTFLSIALFQKQNQKIILCES